MSPIKINHDKEVFESVSQYKDYLTDITESINFPETWKKEQSFEIEIKKSFLRGIIRYSQPTISLIERIRNISKNRFDENDNLNWMSLPYPMIHLPGDQIERGVYHYDDRQNNFYTCWIPLINYEYNSLSFFKFQNKLVELFSPILLRSNLCEVASSKIKAEQGNVFFWNGKLIHKGNLNTSNKTSMAVQFKLTKDVYVYEQTSSLHKKIDLNENFMNFSKSEIQNLFDEYYEINLEIKKDQDNKDYKKAIKNILKNFNKKSLPISFALSLLSQRIATHKKFFTDFHITPSFTEVLDLVSIVIGSANLISLHRLKTKLNNLNELEKLLKDLNIFNAIPFETSQFKSILSNNNFLSNNHFRT